MSTKIKNARSVLESLTGELSLGAALEAERLSLDLSLTKFSKILGISVQHLSDIEKGRRFVSPEKAAELAKKIGDSEALFVELALQDSLARSNLRFKVKVEAA